MAKDIIPSPQAFASGLAIASEEELLNYLALFEHVPLADKVTKSSHDPLAEIASKYPSKEALAVRLWEVVVTALVPSSKCHPLSMRKLRAHCNMLGVAISELLSREYRQEHFVEKTKQSVLARTKNAVGLLLGRQELLSFPDIIGIELTALMGKINVRDFQVDLDEDIAKTLGEARALYITGGGIVGGWAVFSALVGANGFAPYIMAAKLSAFVPLVSGKMLVSFLAVISNPVTVTAGALAMGGYAVKKIQANTRARIAARVMILLVARGMVDDGFKEAEFLGYLRYFNQARLNELGLHIKDEIYPPIAWKKFYRGGDSSSKEALLVAGLTVGEVVYHISFINPEVLKAADFCRVEDMDGVLKFITNVEDFTNRGAFFQLQGYVGERFVAERLIFEGHHVEFPDSASEPGYDLIVDGVCVQVKTGENLGLINGHFERYPDIPVIANVELIEKASDTYGGMLTSVEYFELETIRNITNQTISAAENLSQVEVMQWSSLVLLAKGGWNAWRGRIGFGDLPAWFALAFANRWGMIFVGGKLGALAGLLLIGPAGALILAPAGSLVALLGVNTTEGFIKDKILYRDWSARIVAQAHDLHQLCINSLERRAGLLSKKAMAMRVAGDADLHDFVVSRAYDDVISIFETIREFERPETVAQVKRLLWQARFENFFEPGVLRSMDNLAREIKKGPPSRLRINKKTAP